jgi:predicted Holliday junction resolvase-like endonuclease
VAKAPNIGRLFGQLGRILCVCPECSDLFYLSEARPYLAGKQTHSVVDDLRAAEHRLERAEDTLNEIESALRETAAKAGLRAAKKALKKIDPVFRGAGYNPHDVRVIFDPVTYIVFNGMGEGRPREIILLAKPVQSSRAERLQSSIERAVQNGNFEFRALHVGKDGSVCAR